MPAPPPRPQPAANGCLAFLGGLAAVAGLLLYSAYIVAVLWGWFIQPLGAPHLTLPSAMGLDLIASILVMRVPSKAELAERTVSERFASSIFVLSVIFLAGFLLHLFA